MSTNGKPKSMMRKIPPPPPSIGSSTGDSSSTPRAPPSPSIAPSKRSFGTISDTSSSKRQRKELENSGIPNLTPEQKRLLDNDQTKLQWLFGRASGFHMSYDALILGRIVSQVEPELYVDTTFCRAGILQELMDIKYAILDGNKQHFFDTRNNMSKYERLLGKDTWYHNADFIKMANIDALMDFQLSQPRTARNENLVEGNDLLYFADICGGPGGFPEYMLWKKQWNARGFGFTSKVNNDYDLPTKPHFPKECFEAVYGFFDLKGEGNIMKPEEIDFFVRHVRKVTGRKGVHVAVASGGDFADGDEDKKELKCKYMFLAEVMIAIAIVRDGGHFVMRLYDIFTPFTAGLLFFLHQMFDSISLHKTETTLAASSERYVLCKWRKPNRFTRELINYFADCQKFFKNTQRMHKQADQQAEIHELVPLSILRNNQRFMSFLMDCNEVYGRKQLEETKRLISEIKNQRTQHFIRQHMLNIYQKATTLWGIPKTFAVGAKYSDAGSPEIRAAKLCLPYTPETIQRIDKEGEQELNFTTLEDELCCPEEWHLFMVGRDRGFFLSLGGSEVYRLHQGCWTKVVDRLELAANTLVYGDIVDEICIFESKQVTTTGFQIIDAMTLGGKDIRNLPHTERLELCCKFAKANDRPNRQDLAAVRAKVPYELTKVEALMKRVLMHQLKGGGRGPSKETTFPVDGSKFFEDSKHELVFKPSGVLLVKTIKQNAIAADFLFSMQNRLIWRWQENVSLDLANEEALEDAKEKHGPVHAATLVHYLKNLRED